MRDDAPVPIRLPVLVRALRRLEFPHKLGIMDRLFGRSLAPCGVSWVETFPGLPWRLDLRNPTHRWIVYGYYEGSGIYRWARRELPQDAVIVDSGANVGQTVLYWLWLRPRARVLAVEPLGPAADWLEQSLRANRAESVQVERIALGATSGHVALEDAGPEHTHGSWARVAPGRPGSVPIAPVGQLLARQGLHHVDLWKLDLEGHELPALEGAADLLAAHRVGALWVELHGENGERIRELLAARRYRAWRPLPSGTLVPLPAAVAHGYGLFLKHEP